MRGDAAPGLVRWAVGQAGVALYTPMPMTIIIVTTVLVIAVTMRFLYRCLV